MGQSSPYPLRDWDSYTNLVASPECICYLHVVHKKTFVQIGRLLSLNKNIVHAIFRRGGFVHQSYNLYDAALEDTRFIKDSFQRLEAQAWLKNNAIEMLRRFAGHTSMSYRQERNLAEKETSGAGDWRLDLDDKATILGETQPVALCQLYTLQTLASISLRALDDLLCCNTSSIPN
jgi:hypothetical protein